MICTTKRLITNRLIIKRLIVRIILNITKYRKAESIFWFLKNTFFNLLNL